MGLVESELEQRFTIAESKIQGEWKKELEKRVFTVLGELDEIANTVTTD